MLLQFKRFSACRHPGTLGKSYELNLEEKDGQTGDAYRGMTKVTHIVTREYALLSYGVVHWRNSGVRGLRKLDPANCKPYLPTTLHRNPPFRSTHLTARPLCLSLRELV